MIILNGPYSVLFIYEHHKESCDDYLVIAIMTTVLSFLDDSDLSLWGPVDRASTLPGLASLLSRPVQHRQKSKILGGLGTRKPLNSEPEAPTADVAFERVLSQDQGQWCTNHFGSKSL